MLYSNMELIEIYRCLCDTTRLRILHLLNHGPLCVCHFQEILEVSQTKISQHLAYLRKRGLVEVQRQANWKIYRLPTQISPELDANLRCLQDCVSENKLFQADLKKMAQAQSECRRIQALPH